jgi:hypothetical protein
VSFRVVISLSQLLNGVTQTAEQFSLEYFGEFAYSHRYYDLFVLVGMAVSFVIVGFFSLKHLRFSTR